MRGLFLKRGVVEYRRDLVPPEPGEGEVAVRVRRAGVCATDLALRAGYMGFEGVLGHEFVGEALGGSLSGQRVVGEINAACGTCEACRTGGDRHCPSRTVLGILGRSGCFAEQLCLPERNLYAVPDDVSDAAAVFAEPLAAAFRIAEQLDLSRHRRALVAGDGRLGVLCAHVLASAGLEVVCAGRHATRQEVLAGVRHVTGWLEEDVPAQAERTFDLAVEATGRPETLPRLLRWLKPQGTLVLKTTAAADGALDLSPFVVDEIHIVGSRCGRFGPALEALAAGTIPVERMIDLVLPLADGAEALDRAARAGVLKVQIQVAT